MSARAQLNTEAPVKVLEVIIEGGDTTEASDLPAVRSPVFPVVGFRPATRHEVRVVFLTETGEEQVSEPVVVRTPPLPDGFPTIVSRKEATEVELEGGHLLLGLSPLVPTEPMAQSGLLILLDAEGEVVWYLETESSLGEIEQLPNGNLLVQKMKDLCHDEIDWTGRVVRSWQAAGLRKSAPGQVPVEVETFHHDFQTGTGGKVYALSSQRIGDLIDEEIVRYDSTGKVDYRLSLGSLLDSERKLHPDFPNYYEYFYGRGVVDWGHANSLQVDEKTQTAVVSLAHQDALVKVDLLKRELLWILGRPRGWKAPWEARLLKPESNFPWPTRQHSAILTAQGNWLCFDNGTEFSRAVEFRVDEQAGTVEQVWEFRDKQPFHSNLLGEVRQLPKTGNIQIVDGARVVDNVRRWARILEVSHSQEPRVLWELSFRRPGTLGCSIYRAVRLESWP